jgi:hypothetical protein
MNTDMYGTSAHFNCVFHKFRPISLCVCMSTSLSLLGNGSLKIFFNPLLFASCTNTFSKCCGWHVSTWFHWLSSSIVWASDELLVGPFEKGERQPLGHCSWWVLKYHRQRWLWKFSVTLEGLPYRVGIRVGLVHYLEVLQHVEISVQSSRSQRNGSVGYGGRILREGNSWGGEPILTYIKMETNTWSSRRMKGVVLYAVRVVAKDRRAGRVNSSKNFI